MTTTDIKILPIQPGLEDAVKNSIATRETMKREATARAVITSAMMTLATAAAATVPSKGRKPQRSRHHRKPKPAPMPAIRLGRMAEAAWSFLSPIEREHGVQLWKLAALANLHFVPVPGKLESAAGPLLVHFLVNPTTHHATQRYGLAWVSRPTPGQGAALQGIKIYDHQGSLLVAAGQAPVGQFETVSPFTAGILDGPDVLVQNWVYRTKDKKPSPEITQFIRACLPLRRAL